MTLDNIMVLERLSSGNLESPISTFVRNLIHKKPLLWTTNTSRHSNANHKWLCRFDALGLAFVLLVDPMELRELSVRQGKRPGGVVHEALGDDPSKILRSGLGVLVGDRLRLCRRDFDVVDPQRLPQLRFPRFAPCLGSVGILIISQYEFHQSFHPKNFQLGVEIFAQLVAVMSVFGPGPVVAISQEDGELGLCEGSISPGRSGGHCLLESPSILRELSLTRRGGDEHDVLFLREVVDTDRLHREFSTTRQPLRDLLSPSTIGAVKGQGESVDAS